MYDILSRFLPLWTGDCLAPTSMFHYSDVTMGAMASQITSLTIVYSIVHSGVDERKHQSSASLAFVRGIHRSPVNSPHKGPVTRKMFPFDDVIMFSWDVPAASIFLNIFFAVASSPHQPWNLTLKLVRPDGTWYSATYSGPRDSNLSCPKIF